MKEEVATFVATRNKRRIVDEARRKKCHCVRPLLRRRFRIKAGDFFGDLFNAESGVSGNDKSNRHVNGSFWRPPRSAFVGQLHRFDPGVALTKALDRQRFVALDHCSDCINRNFSQPNRRGTVHYERAGSESNSTIVGNGGGAHFKGWYDHLNGGNQRFCEWHVRIVTKVHDLPPSAVLNARRAGSICRILANTSCKALR